MSIRTTTLALTFALAVTAPALAFDYGERAQEINALYSENNLRKLDIRLPDGPLISEAEAIAALANLETLQGIRADAMPMLTETLDVAAAETGESLDGLSMKEKAALAQRTFRNAKGHDTRLQKVVQILGQAEPGSEAMRTNAKLLMTTMERRAEGAETLSADKRAELGQALVNLADAAKAFAAGDAALLAQAEALQLQATTFIAHEPVIADTSPPTAETEASGTKAESASAAPESETEPKAAAAGDFDMDGFLAKLNDFAENRLVADPSFSDPRLGGGQTHATEEIVASLDAYEQLRLWREEMRPDLIRAVEAAEAMKAAKSGPNAVQPDASLAVRASDVGRFLEDEGKANWLQFATEQLELTASDASARETAMNVLEGVELQAISLPVLPVLTRMEVAGALGPKLDLAGRFLPGDETVDARIADLREQTGPLVQAAFDGARDEIAKQEWRGGDADAPEVPGAKARLADHPDWKDYEILKVTIDGDWFVFRRNILGQPVQHAIPGYVAAVTPRTPDGMVRVYHVSFVTREADKDPDDFGAIAVTPENWTMLRENLPE